MKLSKEQLKTIIKEEVIRALKEEPMRLNLSGIEKNDVLTIKQLFKKARSFGMKIFIGKYPRTNIIFSARNNAGRFSVYVDKQYNNEILVNFNTGDMDGNDDINEFMADGGTIDDFDPIKRKAKREKERAEERDRRDRGFLD